MYVYAYKYTLHKSKCLHLTRTIYTHLYYSQTLSYNKICDVQGLNNNPNNTPIRNTYNIKGSYQVLAGTCYIHLASTSRQSILKINHQTTMLSTPIYSYIILSINQQSQSLCSHSEHTSKV